jgi:hypothetical protein
MSTSNQTHNHQTIREWAEQRGGVPARVMGTEINGDAGILRIHFPKFSKNEELQEISWEDFFNDFEKDRLDFLYQDHKTNGEQSTFYKLVTRVG